MDVLLFTLRDVKEYIEKEVSALSQSVLEAIVEQKIDGEVFLELDDEFLREIAPLCGDRIKIKKAIRKAKSCSTKVRLIINTIVGVNIAPR